MLVFVLYIAAGIFAVLLILSVLSHFLGRHLIRSCIRGADGSITWMRWKRFRFFSPSGELDLYSAAFISLLFIIFPLDLSTVYRIRYVDARGRDHIARVSGGFSGVNWETNYVVDDSENPDFSSRDA